MDEVPPQQQVSSTPLPVKKPPIFLIVSIGIFLLILLVFIGMLALFLSTQRKTESTPAQNRIPTLTPTPTTILKQQYDNPFDQKSQYKNPFEKSNNPFNALSQ